jgi:hypothetical protein
MARRRIDAIVIGERIRRELGDLGPLAANMAELGLLHSIVIAREWAAPQERHLRVKRKTRRAGLSRHASRCIRKARPTLLKMKGAFYGYMP